MENSISTMFATLAGMMIPAQRGICGIGFGGIDPAYSTGGSGGGLPSDSASDDTIILTQSQREALLLLRDDQTSDGIAFLFGPPFTESAAVQQFNDGNISLAALAFLGIVAPTTHPSKDHTVLSPALPAEANATVREMQITSGAAITVHVPKNKKVRCYIFSPRQVLTPVAVVPPYVAVQLSEGTTVTNSDDSEEHTFTTKWVEQGLNVVGGAGTYSACPAGQYEVTIRSEIF